MMQMNSRGFFLQAWACLALLLLVGCSEREKNAAISRPASESIELKSDKGPVTMLVRIWPKEPRLSDLVDLDIEVAADADVLIVPPAFGQAVGDFLVRDYTERTPKKTSDQSKPNRRIFHYQLEPASSGIHLIRSVAIEFIDNREISEQKGAPNWIESEPIEIKITSELGDQVPSLANLEPMAPPQSIHDSLLVWWLAGSLLALAALAAYFLSRRRNAKPMVEYLPSAEEIAHSQLASLLSENLPSQGMFKDFYLRLTGIVRTYIEGVTGLRAPEQTTEEFLSEIGKESVFSSGQSNRLKEFLEAADMVKYAGQRPEATQVDNSILRAKEFIDMKPRATESNPSPNNMMREGGL